MIKDPRDLAPTGTDVAPDAVDDATELSVLRSLVDDLEHDNVTLEHNKVALEHDKVTLTEGLANRQHIGFVTGVLAQRYGLQPDAAWKLLSHVSQELNVKAVRVADILLAVYTGKLASRDVELAVRISALLPPGPDAGTDDASASAVDPQR